MREKSSAAEPTARADDTSKRLKRAFLGVSVSTFLGIPAALGCLRQWGSAEPWARLDIFSGTYLVLSALLSVALAFGFNRTAFGSTELLREAAGMGYDKAPLRWGSFLAPAELSVFLDYGHWHLVPALERPALQTFGLALGIASAAWLLWTDSCLVRHFSGDLAHRELMTDGPFRYIRHPRYLSVLAVKLASALAFASVLGWGLWLAWVLLLLRRMRLEEAHLREIFGDAYARYTQRTARLLPGLY